MKITDRQSFEELKATGRLPSPKGVALAILNLTRQEEFTSAEVTRLVQSDPALAGRLLKLANAAGKSLGRPIVSLSQAVMVLGIPMVRKTALSLSLLTHNRTGTCAGFDYRTFWSRSLAMAIAHQWLGHRAMSSDDETFTCGLLAEVGRLALATLFPQKYDGVLQQARQQPAAELLELEQQAFGTDHRELTSALLSEWGLPPIFVEAVYSHEQPEEGSFEEGSRLLRLTQSLHFSACLADLCMQPENERVRFLPRVYVLGARLGMDTEEVHLFCDQVIAEWQEWGKTFNVPTQELKPFAEMAAAMPARPAEGKGNGQPGFSLRILVVDDSGTVLVFLRRMLAEIGHAVFTARNGQEGLAKALEVEPHVVITDLVMPEMDGLDFCRTLRESRAGNMMYIIMLTVMEHEDKLVEAFEAGADDYVVKPVSERALKARLQAGQRVAQLQREILLEREEMRRSAAELALANQRLRSLALTDSLTQVPNRRYGLDRLEQEWAASGRDGKPLSCLLIDVDHFKRINDSLGHDVGDRVLHQSAQLLKKSMRPHDVLCRWGGEEFLLICPDTDLNGATNIAERIRKAFETSIFDDLPLKRLTVSIGVASREMKMETFGEHLKAADRALYAAKDAGRNKVMVFGQRS